MQARRSLLFLILLCVVMGSAAEVPVRRGEARRIVPGKRVGHVVLGTFLEPLLLRFGRPTASDAGAGNLYSTWKTGKYELVIHSIWGGDHDHQRVIVDVSVTSPWFRTRDGIGVGSRWATIHRHFPAARMEAEPEQTADGVKYRCFDMTRGIAFEIARSKNESLNQGRCIRVTVLKPEKDEQTAASQPR